MAKAAGHYGESYDPPSTGLSKLPSGWLSTKDYELPVTDVETERRNFLGCVTENVFGLEDIQSGDTAGTTDTDSQTHEYTNPGYTRIYYDNTTTKRTNGGKELPIRALGASRL